MESLRNSVDYYFSLTCSPKGLRLLHRTNNISYALFLYADYQLSTLISGVHYRHYRLAFYDGQPKNQEVTGYNPQLSDLIDGARDTKVFEPLLVYLLETLDNEPIKQFIEEFIRDQQASPAYH